MDEKNNFLLDSSLKKVAPSKNANKNENEANNTAVPDFIQKLFRMLENKAFKDVFCWDSSGTSFLVKDTNEFSRSILPKHFKHCNFASFVRQLNKYDFHKIRSNADENQRLYGDQTWQFEHVNFRRDRKDLLEEIRRKTPGKKKKSFENTMETKPQMPVNMNHAIKTSNETPLTAADRSAFEDLKKLTRDLQSQVDQLKRSHVELEETLDNMNKKEQMIMAELSGFQQSLKTKDELLKECLKLQQQQTDKSPEKTVKIETIDNNEWTEQSTIPIESILTDLFLPTPTTQQQENTASVAAAAAQLNGGSLIGSSIKTSEGLTVLALGRLSSNKEEQQPPTSEPTPTPTTLTIDKGKKKMPASWTTPPRVLLVDDDSVYRDVSGKMLNMIGCSIDLAKDGLEALQKMSIEKYDLILMDIVMPKMDGIVTTRNIRRYDSLTPIVSMTSNFTHNDIMEYIGIGMNDILPKPFSKSTLYDILEKHCAHLKIIQQQQISTDLLTNPRGLQPASITPIMDESSANNNNNYAYDNTTTTTTNNLVNNNTNTPSTASSSTPPNNSPTPTTDTGYWQPLDNRKLVWSSSPTTSPSTSPSNHPHHQHHRQHQPNKRQKLHDLYDTTAPSY